MSTKQKRRFDIWRGITGESGRRLMRPVVPDGAPEFRELEAEWILGTITIVSDTETAYGWHYGEVIGISIDGTVIIRIVHLNCLWAAREAFGGGNTVKTQTF